MELVYTEDKELWEAVDIVHKEAQALQAQMAQAQAPTQAEGQQPMDPAAMQPGMAMAGAPGTQGAAIPPANPSQVNLSTLLMNLRNPQRRINEGSS